MCSTSSPHGTGTRLGDPVEVNALNDAFRGSGLARASVALTSTKSNFGHTFAASGLVSLIALVEAMRRGLMPASLHCAEDNEFIAWAQGPFFVNKTERAWDLPPGRERLGAVSAFGMSGTNAHVVLEGFSNALMPRVAPPASVLLVLSAKTDEALRERIAALRHAIEREPTSSELIERVSFTLLDGRHHFRRRLAIVARDAADAVSQLARALAGEAPEIMRGAVSDQFDPNRERDARGG